MKVGRLPACSGGTVLRGVGQAMDSELTLVIFAVGGLGAGFLAGLFGIGGGLIMVPVLVYAFAAAGVEPQHIVALALGTSMAAIAFSAAQSAYGHYRRGSVSGPTLRRAAPWAILGAMIGSALAAATPRVTLLIFVGCFQFIAAALMLADVSKYEIVKCIACREMALRLCSIAFGGIAAMAGVAGGTLFTPYFTASGMALKRAIGTSAAIGLPISVAAALAYAWAGRGAPLGRWTVGYIHLPALAALVAGTLLTVRPGVSVAHWLPSRVLAGAFAVFLTANGVHLLYFASK